MKCCHVILGLTCLKLAFGGPIFAQENADEDLALLSDEAGTIVASDRPLGWAWSAQLALGLNAVEHDHVVGQTDGRTNLYAGKLDLGLDHVQEHAEWNTALQLDETFSRTPTIDRMVKSSDLLQLQSIYKAFLPSVAWLGAYGSGVATTNAFATYDERAEEVTYVISRENAVETETAERFRLYRAFRPLTMKESAGGVIKISEDPRYKTEVRSGLGARQIYLQDGFYLTDDEETAEVEVTQYGDDVRIVGWESALLVEGSFDDERFTYKASFESLVPFAYHPEGDGDEPARRLVSTETLVSASYKLLEWLAFAYEFQAKREPLIEPKAQVSQSALLTATLKTSG